MPFKEYRAIFWCELTQLQGLVTLLIKRNLALQKKYLYFTIKIKPIIMGTTIFFKDTRDPEADVIIAKRCLMFKEDDTLFFATLPDGERFMIPDGLPFEERTIPAFSAPDDINTPIKVVVGVGAAGFLGADNRAKCEVRIVPDGGTLTYDGSRYEVIPAD